MAFLPAWRGVGFELRLINGLVEKGSVVKGVQERFMGCDWMNRVNWLKSLYRMGIRLPKLLRISRLERALTQRKNAIHSISTSPERFELLPSASSRNMGNRMRLALMSMPVMASIADSLWLSFTSLANNPVSPRGEVDEQFIGKLEGYAKMLGVGSIGYARIPQEIIFQEKAVLYKYAIVLVMEMDKDKINLAPSEETAFMVFQSYDALGLAVNELTRFLREHGYTAHAGHPLGGLVLYPALAEVAGLGWHGRHGLLITPEFGPRVRLAAIFTSVENLPVITENPHSWVEEFCYAGCGKCVRRCPPQAILEHPIRRGQSLLTHIDSNRCFPFFVRNHGCSICIKECTFNQKDYNVIRSSFLT